MADAAKLREARRRKITENAEARMNKLLGLTKNSDQNDESVSQNSSSDSQQAEQEPYNLRLRSHGTKIPDFVIPTAKEERSSNRHSDEPIHATHLNYVAKTFAEVNTVHQAPMTQSEVTVKDKDSVSDFFHALNARTLEILKIVAFIIAAFVTRFALRFDISLFILQSIFVPFIMLEVTFELIIYKYLQHVSLFTFKSPMMSAALMLCGMKQEILDTYSSIMARITSWTSDFFLYLFSFIFWNAFIV